MHIYTLMHVQHASLLLCVLSAFQRACFCAGTDDAAGRSMTIAGSTSMLAHLQKALAPGSHYIGYIKAACPSAVWPIDNGCDAHTVKCGAIIFLKSRAEIIS